MNTWSVQDAKARFRELLDTCLKEGPQLVTRRGAQAAVLISVAEWRRLKSRKRPTLKEWLLADDARCDLNIPPRRRLRRA